jgi:uncharacterized membrane protein
VTTPTANRDVRHANARALAKAISWRLFGTAGTSAIVLFFTRRWDLALSVGGVEGVAKIGLFFIHERLWDRIAFGRRRGPGAGGEEQDGGEPPAAPS